MMTLKTSSKQGHAVSAVEKLGTRIKSATCRQKSDLATFVDSLVTGPVTAPTICASIAAAWATWHASADAHSTTRNASSVAPNGMHLSIVCTMFPRRMPSSSAVSPATAVGTLLAWKNLSIQFHKPASVVAHTPTVALIATFPH